MPEQLAGRGMLYMGPCGIRLLLPALAAALLQAQQPAGEIRLEVKDSSGAAVEASGRLRSRRRRIRPQLPDGCRRASIGFPICLTAATGWRFPKTGSPPSPSLIDVQSATPVSRTVTLALAARSPPESMWSRPRRLPEPISRPTRLRARSRPPRRPISRTAARSTWRIS